jgi:hypothetical protein
MAVYEKPPKRPISPSRGKHRRDLIAEYNKRYAEQPAQEGAEPPSDANDGKKAE